MNRSGPLPPEFEPVGDAAMRVVARMAEAMSSTGEELVLEAQAARLTAEQNQQRIERLMEREAALARGVDR